MRAIPVDTTKITLIGTGKCAARAKYGELADGTRKRIPDAQDTNDEGVPMWIVDVLVDDPDADRAEIASVKVASYDEPTTERLKPVKFVGLVAVPYVAQGTNRVALSFRADGIEGQGRKSGQPQGEQNAA
ncbi:hypothetical protein [Pseudonocardia alni]|uniref:hypothetical protein n=1 Tax=Pseudonocardia alni TaxID=33907 RepID=UPI0033E8580A